MSAVLEAPAPWTFTLPAAQEATAPPRQRGIARDHTRMLVARRHDGALHDAVLADLPEVLCPGDLLVVNTSATLPAAVDAQRADGLALRLHLSSPLPGGLFSAEVRLPDGVGSRRWKGGRAGDVLTLPGARAVLLRPQADEGVPRLWVVDLALDAVPDDTVMTWLARVGQPIRYAHTGGAWPLSDYQTVFARHRDGRRPAREPEPMPGSAEAPSAALGFTDRLVTRLVLGGIGVVPLALHTGVSSLEDDEAPYPERYRVPPPTAERVNATRAAGGHIIAVGTTVARALETVADDQGHVRPGGGWTDLVVDPARGVRIIDGLLTGWHAPRTSHLRMLEAVAGGELLAASYRAALDGGYLWHEFGDLHLILP